MLKTNRTRKYQADSPPGGMGEVGKGGGGKELGVGVGGAKHQSQTSKTFISSPGACTSGSSLNKARASSVELNLSLM